MASQFSLLLSRLAFAIYLAYLPYLPTTQEPGGLVLPARIRQALNITPKDPSLLRTMSKYIKTTAAPRDSRGFIDASLPSILTPTLSHPSPSSIFVDLPFP
ncbi:hypothetical protein GGR52DRAFT_364624 [Hypoxylon sp. FL1284]|nr:hypothetical protein GGR52DRAFT_364624 [Hypoxylon sp. FL1284]